MLEAFHRLLPIGHRNLHAQVNTIKGIYILTCKPTGLSYVGQSRDIPRRLQKHWTRQESYIGNTIKKYGRDNFTVEIIAYSGASTDALNAIEKWHISIRQTQRPNGDNLTPGGDANPMDVSEIRAKVSRKTSETNKKRWQEPEYRRRMIQHGKGNKSSIGAGASATAEIRKKRSRIAKQRWQDPKYRETMSQHSQGKNNSSYGKGKYAEHANEIVALHQEGWTYGDIAEKFGGNRQTGAASVRRLIKRRLQR